MQKKLFLLDGMALVYRAHFALIQRPIFTSKGVNTSALYGFTQTLLDILNNQKPTHMALVFDTDVPTMRHKEFPEYKAQRESMPEDLSQALPHVRRMAEAFRLPVITCDGWEADDVIGTLVRCAQKEGFTSFMVTPDKDFGQLVSESTFLFKPSRMGDAIEILGVKEILEKWGIQKPEQVIDILGLWGDATDNIPGVPGIGEKTASKLITQYGTLENLLDHTSELKGKLKENLETHREQALLSKRLATILCDAPCDIDLEKLKVLEPDSEKLKQILTEFEFNSIGRRLFGEEFKAGRGFSAQATTEPAAPATEVKTPASGGELFSSAEMVGREPDVSEERVIDPADLKSIRDVSPQYRVVQTADELSSLVSALGKRGSFGLAAVAQGEDAKQAELLGLSFCMEKREAYYVPLNRTEQETNERLQRLRSILENESIEKVGHDLKFILSLLKWRGLDVRGKLFDLMLVHSLVEPDLRHTLEYLSEAFLGYSPISMAKLLTEGGVTKLQDAPSDRLVELGAEKADVAWQLREKLEPLLKKKAQERVYYEIEAPLTPVLVDMEFEGIRLDSSALQEFGLQLGKEMEQEESAIFSSAGRKFNLNSPKQLGEILFEVLKISESPKKTKTGQYATDEQTLMSLAPEHDIVRRLLHFRGLSKLKSTYVDALPAAVWAKTGRVHTTYNQAVTSTGRLNSQNPNLQNIPIRSEMGKEIRKAFIPRDEKHLLLSADYSQIELRIIAALTKESGLLEAFEKDLDVHTATAARVYGVTLDAVTSEMRRKAKMVNYGIAYGISAFGLAQRLAIPRKEASTIIEQYFIQFPKIKKYMTDTIAFAQQYGFVETVTGRRRYIRDIRSSNATVRAGAERNAINAPIQGTAADMIKIAMVNIHREFQARKFKSRMLLQVHDELVFDLHKPEKEDVLSVVEKEMRMAIPLEVPIVVEAGVGNNWLEAH